MSARAAHAAGAAVLVLCLTAPAAAVAQPSAPRQFHQYLRQHWALEEGLPQVGVGDLAQDRDGFLWIGTQDGLARFDGLEFRVFSTDTAAGLAGDSITRLAFDERGVLWIGTRTGLSRYDGRAFLPVPASAASLGVIHGLTPVPGGVLVASDSGLHRAPAGGTSLEPVAGVADPRVFFAAREETDALLVGVPGAVARLRNGVRTVHALGAADAIPRTHVRCGADWIATSVGLWRLEAERLIPFEPLARKNINALHCDPHGVLWVGTGSGLLRVRSDAVVEAIEDEERLPHPFVTSFLRGSDGALWFGTLTGGVYRLTEGRYLRHNRLSGLPFSATFAVAPGRSGGVWIGGQDGIVRLRDGGFERPAGTPRRAARGSAEPLVTTALEDRAGRLWIGTRTGAQMVDLATGRTTRLLDTMVLAFAESPDGTIWIGGVSGLYSYAGGRLVREGEQEGIARVRAILHSARYGLMAGAEQGVFVRRDEEGGFERFDGPIAETPRRVGSLFEAPNGDVWVGYLGAGLARYAAARGAWTVFTERHGLMSDTVSGVRIGRDGHVWIAGHSGVMRVAPGMFDEVAANATRRLTGDVIVSIGGREPGSSAGYCCNAGTGSSIMLDAGGSLWLPSLDGVVQIDTGQPRVVRALPGAVLVSLRHGRENRLFADGDGVVLPASDRDVEFTFSAPVFDQPAITGFHYRLDGYDDSWKTVQGRRSVSYTNLPPRAYRFRVRTGPRAGDSDAGGEAAWAFSIEPRFTETWWFYGLLAPVVLGAAYGAHALRLGRLQQQRVRLERLVTERTTELKGANDELARVNALLREQSYTDPLTRLHNRRYLADRVGRDLAQVHRLREQAGSAGLAIVFLLVDLDHFKRVNDLHGHDAGDRVLAETARRLAAVARDTDHVIRWGGEEFLFVVCFSAWDHAPRIAERVMQALWTDPFTLAGGTLLHMTGSLGFSVCPFTGGASSARGDDKSWEQAVARADRALYVMKENGRNGWAGILPGPDGEETLVRGRRGN